ncbi:protein of unknown function [Bradyrhizobium vignae]|uniref:Uncharacterized protein n=1 Tax=Bradyrhizobium vignae TaxID=1549949 RepID=A0A2U3PUQ8_9BRAD|nr:protein of unknown function [Bradyrhizobium vignae]
MNPSKVGDREDDHLLTRPQPSSASANTVLDSPPGVEGVARALAALAAAAETKSHTW